MRVLHSEYCVQGQQVLFSNLAIKKSGCYFLCLLHWFDLSYHYSEEMVEKLYQLFSSLGWIKSDCWVVKPKDILNYLNNHLFGATTTVKQVLKVEKFDDDYMKEGIPYIVGLCGDKHFVIVKDGLIIYDPVANSKCGEIGEVSSIRDIQLNAA